MAAWRWHRSISGSVENIGGDSGIMAVSIERSIGIGICMA